VTEELVKAVLSDSVKVVIDKGEDTGKFSLIHEEAVGSRQKAVFTPTIYGWKRVNS
jgi:hypothetical protein